MVPTPAAYHQATAYHRRAMDPHGLDWANQPSPYKSYPVRDGVLLPEVEDLPTTSLQAVYSTDSFQASASLDLAALSRICLLAAGLTARSRHGDGDFYYRSAPSAGALYPNEIYLAALNDAAVPAGIYHVGVHNRFLTRIRAGVHDEKIRAAVPDLPANCGGAFLISGIFFRSAWKYRKRAYRYVLLDAGHLAENLRLAVAAAGYSGRLHLDFDDRALDGLLGLDEAREGTLCLVAMAGGGTSDTVSDAPADTVSPSIPTARRVSPAEVVYPEIVAIHEAAKTVMAPRRSAQGMIQALGVLPPQGFAPLPEAPEAPAAPSYADTVLQRRSKRNFIRNPLERGQLTVLLDLVCRTAERDPMARASLAVGVLAGRVDGLKSGFYLLDAPARRWGCTWSGQEMEAMATVCLDQAWLKNAAVHFVFLSRPDLVGSQWGARGYRYVMISAGRLGHAVYLGATALGLGACGIGAFYDDEAQRLLRLDRDTVMLYLVAAGKVK
ncbi:MAG: SagB/ThcOx family dehydrogenase [Desulfobacteraceae bacterium]|jgi:SagB-type dehydrogenase family enzyme|nr:SagB/ThcOx family dehydrogenase [Desulfobacteraceae bacterium]